MDDLSPMQPAPVDTRIFQEEENVLRTWAEERLGVTDFGLVNPLSQLQEARTATEIQGIQQKARQALSLRGELFYAAVEGIAQDFFDLWHTYGPTTEWVKVTGSEPIRITREDLQGGFFFQVRGTIGEEDEQLQAQKALARIQILAQIKQAGLAEPRYEIDLGEALRDWMEKEDIRASKRVLRRRSDQEVQAIVQEQQRMQALQERALTNQALTPQELEVVLKRLKKDAPHGDAQQLRVNGS